ncbi:MAG: Xaa-Pro aminopeptidase [Pirellulales bacterium]
MIKPVPIPAELFVENRRRLVERLGERALAIVHSNDIMPTNADGTLGHHQNADLFYLSGIGQEESILLLAPNAFDEKLREVLFLREPNEHLLIWEGHKLSKAEAIQISGVKQIRWLSEFPTVLHQLMCESDSVYLNSNEHPRAVVEVQSRDARFIADCQRRFPLHQYRRLAPIMRELRVVKSAAEVAMIREACGITRDGFQRVLKMVRPGVNETEIEAEFAYEFIRRKGFFAYPPIIAAGANSCVLHYGQNDQTCEDGQLVLLDVGCGLNYYMSDMTRTIPVNGRFTPRQRLVYDAVLRTMRSVIEAMRPGVLVRDLRLLTEKLIEEELLRLGLLTPQMIAQQDPENPALRKYFMHGVAHSLGIDVHDVSVPGQPVQIGWVLTCEPGIYIREEGFGIRLENDILVTENGPADLMHDIPVEADEIEQLMNQGGR